MNFYVRMTTKNKDIIVLNRNVTKEEIGEAMRQRKISQKEIEYVLENGIYISESMTFSRKTGKIETGNSGLGSRDILKKDDIVIIFPEAEYSKRKARASFWQKLLKILLG